MQKQTRKKKLVKSGLQLKVVGAFMATAFAATLVQAVTLDLTMRRVSAYLPNDAELFRTVWPQYFTTNVLLTLLLLALTVFGVGVAITHKVAGPLHSMERYLRELRAGRAQAPCHLRKGDQLHEFCELLNEATAPLRAKAPDERVEPSAAQRDAA